MSPHGSGALIKGWCTLDTAGARRKELNPVADGRADGICGLAKLSDLNGQFRKHFNRFSNFSDRLMLLGSFLENLIVMLQSRRTITGMHYALA